MTTSPDWVRDFAWKTAGQHATGTVLDIGSGQGGWLQRLRGSNADRFLSVDIADVGARDLANEFHLCDAASQPLPWPDSSIDCAFAVEVLEHLANPRHAIREVARVLKPGGWLFITTPCCEDIASRVSFALRGYFPAFAEHSYRETGHITPITELDLSRMATEAGLEVHFQFTDRGRIPGTALHWQRVAPFLRGKLFSETLAATLTKPPSVAT